jgi:hypothetical protein
MRTPNKVKKTRKVVFAEDYKTKGGLVIYAKGSIHFIHEKTVEKLAGQKVKMNVSKVDYEESVDKAKEIALAQKEAEKKANKK